MKPYGDQMASVYWHAPKLQPKSAGGLFPMDFIVHRPQGNQCKVVIEIGEHKAVCQSVVIDVPVRICVNSNKKLWIEGRGYIEFIGDICRIHRSPY